MAIPVCPAAGATVIVQLVPLLVSAIFELGTNVGFEEVADTVRFAVGVSASVIVNARGGVALLALIV